MTSYEITYSVDGCIFLVAPTAFILAGTEEGAIETFKVFYPVNHKIRDIRSIPPLDLNGRYSIYFKNK